MEVQRSDAMPLDGSVEVVDQTEVDRFHLRSDGEGTGMEGVQGMGTVQFRGKLENQVESAEATELILEV